MCLQHNDVAFGKQIDFSELLLYNKHGDIMKEDKLGDLSMELSVDVLNLCKRLKSQKETVISN